MAKDVSTLLTEMQTGQYVPTEEEQIALQTPRKRVKTNITSRDELQNILMHPVLADRNESLGLEAGMAGYGTSRYDTSFNYDPDRDLEHARAVTQSSGSKILNGAIKGGITMGTTAVETVAGALDGLLEGGAELVRQASSGESMDLSLALGKGTNNFIARTMSDIQKLSEEWFPNYRTEEERSEKYQDEWWKHVFTANFIGDSFLKNFGFTAGALIGGAAWSKALSVGLKGLAASNLMKGVVAAAEGDAEAVAGLTRVKNLIDAGAIEQVGEKAALKTLAEAAKPLNKMSTMHQLFGGIIGAIGEGTFEGINARSEFAEKELSRIRSERNNELAEYEQSFYSSATPSDGTVRYVMQPDGSVRPELTEKGQLLLAEGRDEIIDKYADAEQYINETADRVAATTLALNVPVLTVQNVMVYGKMLSGGFNTVRNAAKISGSIEKSAGKLAANYSGTGSRIGKVALGMLKNGGSEGAEEMAQGFISSGAKRVADARLTSFNDAGYDRDSMVEYGNWVGAMLDGGMEYLKEGRNWQEGFLGLLTGLVGIPGKGYFKGERGGIFGAVAEANKSVADSRQAADELNALVNSDRFQNAWKGYIRHQKYETDMAESLREDDKYSWKTASDQQLVNDVITFANAGRLQDLNDIVDYYASMSDNDSEGLEVLEASTSKQNEKDVQNNPGKVIANVKEQAAAVKENIQLYNDMYNSMMTIAPVGSSREQIEEMIATAMNINAFEKRFMTMFNEVLDGVEEFVAPIANRDDKGHFEKREDAFRKSKEIYDALGKLFTAVAVPSDADVIERMDAIPTLRKLKSAIEESGNDELWTKINDMSKLAKDRRAFVDKLITLKNLSPEAYNDVAENADTANEKLQEEQAKEEVSTWTSLAAVKEQYASESKRHLGRVDDFVRRMRRAKDSNQHVARFLGIYDRYNDLRQVYIRNSGSLTGLASEMVERAFNNALEDDDVTDTTKVETYEQYISRLQKEVGESSTMNDDLLAKASKLDLDKDTYNDARNKVLAAMNSLNGIKEAMPTREVKPAPAPAVSKDKPLDVSTDPTSASTSVPKDSKKKTTLAKDGKSAEDKIGRTWTIGETVYCYDSTKENPTAETGTVSGFETSTNGDIKLVVQLSDRTLKVSLNNQIPFINKNLPIAPKSELSTLARPVDKYTPDELADEVVAEDEADNPAIQVTHETNHYDQKQYYQTAIPEFNSEDMREYREAKTVEQKKNILKKLKSFIEGKTENFGKLWDKLIAENAFTNAVKNVSVGDEVKFIALPEYSFNDKPIIFMAVEKDGQRYIYNTMRRTGKYEGLQDFLDAFDAEYAAYIAAHPNTEFVFSKTSRVWGKADGIIDYSYEENYAGEQSLGDKIEGYDKDAPIVWITGDGQFETLRGDATATSTIYSWRNMSLSDRLKRRGQIYYLADSGTGGYIPIRLGIEHFGPNNYTNDNPTFNAIREIISNIEGIAGRFFVRFNVDYLSQENADVNVANAIIADENEALHNEVANLKNYLDLSHGFFTFAKTNEGQPILIYDREAGAPGVNAGNESGKLYFTKDTYGTLLEKIAEEKIALDFRPKQNLTSFINRGFLTTNAKKLLPKNVDVYIERWKDGGFKPTDNQKSLITPSPVVDTNTELSASEFTDVEGLISGDNDAMVNGPEFVMVDDFSPSEIGGADTFAPAGNIQAKTQWDRLSKKQQDALVAHYGEDIIDFFNDDTTTDEDRANKLECVGVS